jgi:zinc/manganese transport system ATP-binding protein
MTALITLDNVSVNYGHRVALHEVSGVFQAGSLTAIAGPNGAGKSSLLKAIVGALKPACGKVTLNEALPHTIAYLPQSSLVQRDFPISVEQAVATGFWAETGMGDVINAEKRARVAQALAEVGLAGFEKRQIGELSGGQFQRLLFARVIIQNAPIILLDEPFASVDAETTARLMQILLNWHESGKTVICVLHDLLLIQKYFPESFVLAGKCLGHGHTHKMLEQKLLSFELDMAEICPGPETAEHRHHHD